MEKITFTATFDEEAFIDRICTRLLEMLTTHYNSAPDKDRFLTINEAAEKLNLAVATIYGLVHLSRIPVNKQGKKLYFSERELDQWIRSGRKDTPASIERETDEFIENQAKKKPLWKK